jgi:cytochrome P450
MNSAVAIGPPADEVDDVLHRLLATAEGHADPYPLYRALRAMGPFHRSGLDGVWYTAELDAARRVLLDPCFGKGPRLTIRRHGVSEERVRMAESRPVRPTMITANRPEHGRLRGAAKGAFLPPRVEALRSRIARLVDERLDRLADARTADVMTELAYPLPLTVTGELLGVPEEEREGFLALVMATLGADDPNAAPEAVTRAEAAINEIGIYVSGLVEARRTSPGGDVLSMLIEQHDKGGLDPTELVGTAILLLEAGFLTTTNVIGNGLLALLHHPAEMARLWADPTLVEPAVEEMLRYDTPIQLTTRHVLADVDIDGVEFRAGEDAVILLGAANRDPAWFAEPDRFDVGRPDNGHLSFAWGAHFCLGARIARLEAQLVFAGLRQRFSRLELADEPIRRPGLMLRGLESLPVRFTSH